MAGAPIDALRSVSLFADLDDAELSQVALLFKQRRFAAGETVVKEGADGAAFFLIESGRGDRLGARRRARGPRARATTSARSRSSTRASAPPRSPRRRTSSATGSRSGSSGRSCSRTATSAGSCSTALAKKLRTAES